VTAPATGSDTESGPRPAIRPFGFAAGLLGRNPDVASPSVVLLMGVVVFVLGLEVVRASPDWGFTYGGALNGVLSQLATTGPAAILIAAATAANLFAGAVVARLLGAPAFRSLSDAALAGFAAAVVLDSGTLFLLGGVGLFRWPVLIVLHAAVATAYVATRRRRPLMAGPLRLRTTRPAAWWLLVVAIWAGPLIIQLASPAVPFMDVLPNHVAPVEHIRVFGSFDTLTTSPSPIYGPSRLMLGYVAFLGQLTTMTNLDAVLAEAAFALPLTLLMAAAVRRLARDLFGGSAPFWVLLTFPLTFTFMRIPDARGTVVVFPLAALALSAIAAELKDHRRAARVAASRPATARPADAPDRAPSRRPDLTLAFAIGAGFLVHPLVGLVAMTAVGGSLVLFPAILARKVVPALGSGVVMAIPQVLTMGAVAAPAWVGAAFVAASVGTAFGLAYLVGATADRLDRRGHSNEMAPDMPDRLALPASSDAGWLRPALVGLAIVGLLVLAGRIIAPSGDPTHPSDPGGELMFDFPHLAWLSLAGVALSFARLGRGWIVLGCGIAAGLAAWTASGFVGSANLTQQAVHYEVPKSVEYWLPVMLAVGAAGAIAALCRLRRLRFVRPLAIGVFVVVAVYPISQPFVKDMNLEIDEHPGSVSAGLALREAELGYWVGSPDARLIIDAPRQQVVDELRAEEEAGRLGAGTRVLHIASSFQQWVSVPIGVFTGAIETSISMQPELSIHTEGGRLLGFDQFDQELATGYGYVVVEPSNLPGQLIDRVDSGLVAGGYRQIWSNSQAAVYTRP
jgi:hypothetical protein